MKILIVEDDFKSADMMKRILVSNHNILVAKDGVEGLEMAIKELPDVVITDNNMPRKEGIELVEDIRKLGLKIEIIMVTAYTDTDMIIKCVNNYVKYFLKKPIDPVELKKNILEINRILNLEHDNKVLMGRLQKQNIQLEKLVRIMKHKLKSKSTKKSFTVTSKAQSQPYFVPKEYFLEDHLSELQELESDIDSNLNYCVLSLEFNPKKIEKSAHKIKDYGKVLKKYPIYDELSMHLIELSDALLAYKPDRDVDNVFYSYIESFVFTLMFWRERLLEENNDPNRYDKSLISDIKTIISFTNGIYEDSEIEFF